MKIVCIGAGVMASAFALSQLKHQVSIIASKYDATVVANIQHTGRDARLDISWNQAITFVSASEVKCADLIVIGVSSQGLDWAIEVASKISAEKRVPVVLLTKGLIVEGSRVSLLSERVENALQMDVFSITGPCIAKELANHQPTEVELSGKNPKVLSEVADILTHPNYLVRENLDYIGCQLSSALKNVYAIAIAEAGDDINLRSVRFSDAVLEMAQWVSLAGGKKSTVYGLSVVGDLYVNCLGGRNGRLGAYLSEGMTVAEIMAGPMSGMTVEGLELALELSKTEGSSSKRIFQQLMQRLS